jgi:lipoate-protein ligase A
MLGDALCFLHHTPGDLLLGAAKIVGSAQRKSRGALLQHGSVLLAQSRHTPALPGVSDLTGITLSVPDFCASFAELFTRDTGWPWGPGDWTTAERVRIDDLSATKYASPAWNDKR